ncbi:hypothetical protein NBG4_250007 [Candidatus Sulfobium mesophilum]|uniref:Uncharacterized protein n=1 Tax=Candidatus Sulfobium mesophilum TaxID=2016548 RepID=A0A2U3QGK7_9BACT|nr:hypothetical protein NBG4_250007 [Candidatus Sulfobium mesophilum]
MAIPSNITGPSVKNPRLTATAKPLLAQVHSGLLQMSNAGGASKADSPHQAKRKPPAKSVTCKTVKPTRSVARLYKRNAP